MLGSFKIMLPGVSNSNTSPKLLPVAGPVKPDGFTGMRRLGDNALGFTLSDVVVAVARAERAQKAAHFGRNDARMLVRPRGYA